MTKLSFFTLFHLNISYSSIETGRRESVIRNCYWPLLETIEISDTPIAIEMSGLTVEAIHSLDSRWIAEAQRLMAEGKCELVGSGYSQAIGPLLPAKVNRANLQLGRQIYQDILGVQPTIALVNEQAFSKGLVQLYKEAGYQAVIMEWNNLGSYHAHWPAEYRYHPQQVSDGRGNNLPVIWADSIGFQQFQRYIYGEVEKQDYLNFLNAQIGKLERSFALYSNDAEIFDFRPGRFNTEPQQQGKEWQRIGKLLRDLRQQTTFEFLLPSNLLDQVRGDNNFQSLEPCSSAMPVPVKKQGKYNLLRWANSGRDDLDINTRCWRIFRAIENSPLDDAVWRRLCALWASDYRTHITQQRWQNYLCELKKFELVLSVAQGSLKPPSSGNMPAFSRYLELKKGDAHIVIDSQRGLSIRDCHFGRGTSSPFGVIPHATFHDIRFAADWFSGHMTYETGGQHKITDLTPVVITQHNEDRISAQIDIQKFGSVHKTVQLLSANSLALKYCFDVMPQYDGIWRCCYLTINPDAFDQATLFYATHNGGEVLERFAIDREFNHGRAISSQVSANTALGATQGIVQIGDDKQHLEISFDQAQLAMIPMLSFDKVDDSYLLRFWFSLRELDDTRRFEAGKRCQYEFDVHIKLVD